MSNRFGPYSNSPYGRCLDCSLTIETREHSHQHLDESRNGLSKSHRVRIGNPSREDRIRREAQVEIERALEDAMERLDGFKPDASDDEIREALKLFPDFRGAWDEWVEETT